eukprot:TRINITY_DN179610_c0_g4_i1.p2 TRINITY_DN179610_c0_g4~~TRINITY_DN179610_c0_g4_i1.p2  ORF type:complete len:311 (+),score=59.85 TRINITY_DN179610_c0_g4_i1:141-1073(+)
MNKSDSIYQEVTNQIIDLLEEVKKGDFKRKWFTVGADGVTPHNASSGHIYKGINAVLLSLKAMMREYKYGRWMTYLQLEKLGGNIKGVKGTTVINYGWSYRDEQNKKISEDVYIKLKKLGKEVKAIPYLKKFSVWNVDEIKGLPEKYYQEKKIDNLQNFQSIEDPEFILTNCGANIVEQPQDRAYYSPSLDKIVLPLRGQFLGKASNFYSVAFHELGHWTGNKDRLDRLKGAYFGSPDYAFEELVAEMTAGYLCTITNLDYDMSQTAQYLDNWLQCLKEEPKAIVKAAKLAQDASDYILDSCKENVSIAA